MALRNNAGIRISLSYFNFLTFRRMSKKHKYGLSYYGKIHKSNRKVQIGTQQIHGNCIKNGAKWIHT